MLMNRYITTLIITSLVAGISTMANAEYIDIEAVRYANAKIAQPEVITRYQAFIDDLAVKFPQHNDELALTQMVAHQGLRLWQQAVRDVQSGGFDDRPLYWSRLALKTQLVLSKPAFNITPWQRDILLRSVEKTSRGFSDIAFNHDAQIKILLTGFDPFFLDTDISQSNPSGLAALALDGFTFSANGRLVQVETVMIPMRFKDFDDGIIESLLTPFYRDQSLDMIVTVNMGRDEFDLERFPGRNRSATAPDNANVQTGASKQRPLAPMFDGKTLNGPEFVEFSLPVAAIKSASLPSDFTPWKVNDNHTVSTLAKGEVTVSSLRELQNATSVEGSGGGYLSNEIAYRAVLLRQQFNSPIPVGHINIPQVSGYDATQSAQIVEQLKAMIISAANSL